MRMTKRFLKFFFPVDLDIPSSPFLLAVFLTVESSILLLSLLSKYGMYDLVTLLYELFIVAGLPIFFVWSLKFNRKKLFPFAALSVQKIVLLVCLMVAADIVIDYLTFFSGLVWPLPHWMKLFLEERMRTNGVFSFGEKLFVLCAVPAFCEEILFRGFFQTSVNARHGALISIVAASAMFMLSHGVPQYFPLYFLIGVIFGLTYFLTKTLWAPIICHFVNNAWTFTNFQIGFRLPINGQFQAIDAVIFGAGLTIVVIVFYRLAKVCS